MAMTPGQMLAYCEANQRTWEQTALSYQLMLDEAKLEINSYKATIAVIKKQHPDAVPDPGGPPVVETEPF